MVVSTLRRLYTQARRDPPRTCAAGSLDGNGTTKYGRDSSAPGDELASPCSQLVDVIVDVVLEDSASAREFSRYH